MSSTLLIDVHNEIKLKSIESFNPIIWARLGTGYHFEDLRPEHYMTVIDFIIDYYLPNNVLTRNTYFSQDRTSIRNFMFKILSVMYDHASIVAIDENKNIITAVLLLQIVKKLDFGRVFSRPSINVGSEYGKCVAIKAALNKKADIYLEYNCDIFLRYYLICVKNEYRGEKIGYYLMRYGLEVARALRIPVACGVFPNYGLQKQATRLGFKTINEIYYADWKSDGEVVFKESDDFNKTCAFMVIEVPPPILTEPVVPAPEPDKKAKGKKKKKDKKKKKK